MKTIRTKRELIVLPEGIIKEAIMQYLHFRQDVIGAQRTVVHFNEDADGLLIATVVYDVIELPTKQGDL
jgi:hypothetical protein